MTPMGLRTLSSAWLSLPATKDGTPAQCHSCGSAAAFEQLADQRAFGAALYWRAACEWILGYFDDARQSATRARQLAKDPGDLQAESLALRLHAISQANLPEHHADAVASVERALALVEVVGQPINELEILNPAAHVHNLTGRHQAVLARCQNGLRLARNLEVAASDANWPAILGETYHDLGRYRDAADSLSNALPIFEDHFMNRAHALCLLKLGYSYQPMADHEAAIMRLNESLAIFEELQLSHHAQRVRDTIVSCRNRL
jgi:tetratricopeptide (TPR) repeat protein